MNNPDAPLPWLIVSGGVPGSGEKFTVHHRSHVADKAFDSRCRQFDDMGLDYRIVSPACSSAYLRGK
jgi:hypothetical protein